MKKQKICFFKQKKKGLGPSKSMIFKIEDDDQPRSVITEELTVVKVNPSRVETAWLELDHQ